MKIEVIWRWKEPLSTSYLEITNPNMPLDDLRDAVELRCGDVADATDSLSEAYMTLPGDVGTETGF